MKRIVLLLVKKCYSHKPGVNGAPAPGKSLNDSHREDTKYYWKGLA